MKERVKKLESEVETLKKENKNLEYAFSKLEDDLYFLKLTIDRKDYRIIGDDYFSDYERAQASHDGFVFAGRASNKPSWRKYPDELWVKREPNPPMDK